MISNCEWELFEREKAEQCYLRHARREIRIRPIK